MKKFKAVLNIASWILSFFMLFTVIAVAAATLFGYRFFCVSTGSMEPAYPVGALVVVKPQPCEVLAEGDVITFRTGGAVVTHRVISADYEKMLFETKGDNNNAADLAPVAYGNIIGRVEYSLRGVGFPVLWAQTKLGKILIVDAVIVLISIRIIMYLLDRDDDSPDREEQTE